MFAFGKLSVWTVAAFTLAVGFVMLALTEASAQINIEGLIRGAIGHGGYYGGSRSRSSGHHSSGSSKSHSPKDDDDTADKGTDKSKEKDARDEDTSSHDAKVTVQKQPSGPAREVSQSVETDAPVAKSAGPSGQPDGEPSFSPAR